VQLRMMGRVIGCREGGRGIFSVKIYDVCMWGQDIRCVYVGSRYTMCVRGVKIYDVCMWGQDIRCVYVGSRYTMCVCVC
jgi:hypothetical protein